MREGRKENRPTYYSLTEDEPPWLTTDEQHKIAVRSYCRRHTSIELDPAPKAILAIMPQAATIEKNVDGKWVFIVAQCFLLDSLFRES